MSQNSSGLGYHLIGMDSSGYSDWSVVCLCADWCGVCKQYQAVFDGLAQRNPDVAFHWVDIEDESDAMGEVDVETFPTLLLARGGQVFHLGAMTPHADVLQRLLNDLQGRDAENDRPSPAEAQALWSRIQPVLARKMQKSNG